jgi:MoxR-like ATPase
MPLPSLAPLRKRLESTVLGAEEPASLMLTAMLAGGHVLVEGAPGIGKTTLAHTLASSIGGSFRRIQFTPDLMPGDLLGHSLYRMDRGAFEFIPGPVFANCLLADEINRTPPRVQAALLECMNEGRVTIDGETRVLPNPFFVIATRNDIHDTGTFPLPEPQLDRFLLSIPMGLPNAETQHQILRAHADGAIPETDATAPPLLEIADFLTLRHAAAAIPASDGITRYITALCESLRRFAGADHAVSIRAALAILQAARAHACLDGDPAVYPDHVQAVFPSVMRHRILCDAATPEDSRIWIRETLAQTAVP